LTFVVHAVYAARCPDIHERSNVQRGSDRMPQPRLKIMLVEDDTIIGRYLSEVLEEGGYDVIQCLSNGSDALRAAVPLKPDLVLMDISLPGDIDGVEVARQFKTLHDLPVVFITAHSDRKTIERARDADCYGYVLKPIIDAQVFAAIEMAVQRSNLEGKVRASEEELRLLSAHLQTAQIGRHPARRVPRARAPPKTAAFVPPLVQIGAHDSPSAVLDAIPAQR